MNVASTRFERTLRFVEVLLLALTLVFIARHVHLVGKEVYLSLEHHGASQREVHIDRSAAWLEKIQEPHFWDKLRSTGHILRDQTLQPADRAKAINENGQLHSDLRLVLARFETMATLYNMNLLDKRFMANTLGPALCGYYAASEFWIENYARKEDPAAYSEYQKMVQDLAQLH